MITVANLSKNYNTLRVLKEISFTVKDGEILGFLGPNGAGKTTTMKIITGYTAPSSGSVKVNGLEVSEHPLEVKRQIGYLPEAVPLYDDMTVLEYLKFIADVRLKGSKRDALQNVIKICGLQKMIRRPTAELSKGFRQRTCLAQALIHNPDILILDEPTSGLDPNQIAEIREVIKEIGKEKTVILSTHILQEVQATCDRVIIINEGKIAAQGTTDELERQAQGRQSVYVKMRGLKDKIHQLLLDLPLTDEVSHKDTEGTDGFGFEILVKIDVDDSEDIRELIFRRAVQANAPILEMRLERVSLEEVFRQLTK
ncbi:MAG: ATP-binding cassette domain-containing protein [Patescibacteria group bacterium]